MLVSSFALAFADPQATPDSSGAPGAEFTPLSDEAQAALRDALNFNALQTLPTAPASPLRVRTPHLSGHDLDWKRTDKADGSAALTVKKPLPLQWDTKVGADIGLAPALGTSFQAERLLQPNKDRDSGTAWATITVPGVASIDARVDPAKDQRKLGTTFSQSLPFGSNYSLTLQNSYALTETLGATPTTSAIPNAAAPSQLTQVWSTDRLVKFNIHSTGTTLAAGTFSSTKDYITHNKLMAEQKLFDNFNVTTAVTDVGAPTSSKSITAGFKWQW